jgi:hypothetical protein
LWNPDGFGKIRRNMQRCIDYKAQQGITLGPCPYGHQEHKGIIGQNNKKLTQINNTTHQY